MFYCFSSGILTIAAGQQINLGNDNPSIDGVASRLYTTYPLLLNKITTDFFSAGGGLQENVFVNWRINGTGDWYFNTDVPLQSIYGTPQFPFILDIPIAINNQYIEMKIINTNAVAIQLDIAFFGAVLVDSTQPRIPDLKTKRPYNYQISDSSTATVTIQNGIVTLPAAPAPLPFTGTVSMINSYDDYFELTKIWSWLPLALSERITIRTDSYNLPLINNPTYVRQIVGQSNQPFELPDSIWIKKNERIYIDIRHDEIAPVAPYPMYINFHGNLYHSLSDTRGDLAKTVEGLMPDTSFRGRVLGK